MEILKRIKNKISTRYSIESRELRRIAAIPRYRNGETKLLGESIEFVDSISFLHGYQEIFVDLIYKFNTKVESPRIIDCGANIGLASIYFKRMYPNSKIICFEPDPKIFEVLKRNLKVFKCDDVELVNCAISDKNGTSNFYSEGGFSGSLDNPVSKDQYLVETKKLSGYLSEKVDFLKIDIEGAENFVIPEIQNSLCSVENIFIEYHSHYKKEQKLDEILFILKKEGFRYHILEAFGRSEPFINRKTMLGMDCQLNIIAFRE